MAEASKQILPRMLASVFMIDQQRKLVSGIQFNQRKMAL